jgi:hypothetical protein
MDERLSLADKVGGDAAFLATVEVGLGGLLHAFHVPLSGNFLALNQGFFLTRTALESREEPWVSQSPLMVSAVVAVLKTFAPIGKRWTPAIAIFMQGLFFSAGIFCFGVNILGVLLGMTMVGMWTFAQPFILYYFFFGPYFFTTLEELTQKIFLWFALPPPGLAVIFIALLSVEIFCAWLVGALAYYLPRTVVESYKRKLLSRGSESRAQVAEGSSIFWLAGADLLRPFFLIPALAMFGFSLYRQDPDLFHACLRSLLIGYLFFLLARTELPKILLRSKLVPGRWRESLRVAMERGGGSR